MIWIIRSAKNCLTFSTDWPQVALRFGLLELICILGFGMVSAKPQSAVAIVAESKPDATFLHRNTL